MKHLNKFVKWFELNCGWFFVNGYKQESWKRYLKTKTQEKNEFKN